MTPKHHEVLCDLHVSPLGHSHYFPRAFAAERGRVDIQRVLSLLRDLRQQSLCDPARPITGRGDHLQLFDQKFGLSCIARLQSNGSHVF